MFGDFHLRLLKTVAVLFYSHVSLVATNNFFGKILHDQNNKFFSEDIVVLFLIGKPIYCLEMVVGQFSSRNSVDVYDLSPAMRGLYTIWILTCGISLRNSLLYCGKRNWLRTIVCHNTSDIVLRIHTGNNNEIFDRFILFHTPLEFLSSGMGSRMHQRIR